MLFSFIQALVDMLHAERGKGILGQIVFDSMARFGQGKSAREKWVTMQNGEITGACGYNRPCAHQYVGKYQSCMVD